jgi:hypothetical protein
VNRKHRRAVEYGTAREGSALNQSADSNSGTWRSSAAGGRSDWTPPAPTRDRPRAVAPPAKAASPKLFTNDGAGWACHDCGAPIAALSFEPRHPEVRCPGCYLAYRKSDVYRARLAKRPAPAA